MTLEQVAALAQIAGSVGVVLSLVFVGLQVRQNTAALYRNEHNSTMAQWTVIRMGIAQHRDLAELMTAGLNDETALDPPDQLRLEQFLSEQLWAAFHIWDREQRGVFPRGTHESAVGAYICSLLATPRGSVWWRNAKNVGFYPPYVAIVDALLGKESDWPGRARPNWGRNNSVSRLPLCGRAGHTAGAVTLLATRGLPGRRGRATAADQLRADL